MVNQKGYTLSEILIVLSIFIVIASISLYLYPTFQKKWEVKKFVHQFQEDLYYTQQYAMSHKRPISIILSEGNYTIFSTMDGNLVRRANPADIKFSSGTLGFRIIYNSNGTAIQAGTVYIQSFTEKYKITFYIGKGRFKIEKL